MHQLDRKRHRIPVLVRPAILVFIVLEESVPNNLSLGLFCPADRGKEEGGEGGEEGAGKGEREKWFGETGPLFSLTF